MYSRISIAAYSFDQWMKNYVESHRKSGDYEDNNKALVSYLLADRGFRYIKSYEELCQLADVLKSKGYQTTNPPCTKMQYAKEVDTALHDKNYDCDVYGDQEPTLPERERVALAVDKFDYWMKLIESYRKFRGRVSGSLFMPERGFYIFNPESYCIDHNKALVDFINTSKGSRYIKSYEDLCLLAELVRSKGYQTITPPCTPEEYAEAKGRSEIKSERRI